MANQYGAGIGSFAQGMANGMALAQRYTDMKKLWDKQQEGQPIPALFGNEQTAQASPVELAPAPQGTALPELPQPAGSTEQWAPPLAAQLGATAAPPGPLQAGIEQMQQRKPPVADTPTMTFDQGA